MSENDIKNNNMNFEQAVAEFEEIVAGLEKGDLSLDESVRTFQRGVELSAYCTNKLNEVEKKIKILIGDETKDANKELLQELKDEF